MADVDLGGRVELVVASGKGGVGKSTITSSLSIILSQHGYRLVAVDADAEAPNLHLALGVGEWDEVNPYYEGRIASIIEERCTRCGVCRDVCPLGAVRVLDDGRYVIDELVCEGCITCSINCPERAIKYRFKVESGEIRVARKTRYGFPLVSSEIRPGRPNSGKLVTEAKNTAYGMLGSSGLVLVDAAAGIGCQVISSLTGAHLALLVTEPTPAGLNDLKRIHTLTRHFMIAPMLVINKYDTSREGLEKVLQYAEDSNIPVIGMIPYDNTVPRSLAAAKPLIEFDPGSPASRAVREISERIASDILPNWRVFRRRYAPKRPEPYKPIIVGSP